MNHRSLLAISAAAILAAGVAVAQDTVHIGIIAELSGAGAPSGNNWRDGAEMAVEEINAEGGILGKQIDLTVYDTQTDPQVSRALMQKAIDEGAYVVLGTVYSGSTIVNMLVAQQAGVPQFVGSEAPKVTQMGNPFVFRTSIGAQKGVPSLTPFFKDNLKAAKVGGRLGQQRVRQGRPRRLHRGDAKGRHRGRRRRALRAGRDRLRRRRRQAQELRRRRRLRLHEPGGECPLPASRPANSALPMPLVGDVTLNDQKVIELAGEAAKRRHRPRRPDRRGARDRADGRALPGEVRPPADPGRDQGLHLRLDHQVRHRARRRVRPGEILARRCTACCLKAAEYPNILLDTCWDDTGEMSRAGFMIEVKDGKGVVIGTVPAN